MELIKINQKRVLVALAVICLLAGSSYALVKLMPAMVDEGKCTGCEDCINRCPFEAIDLNEDGIAQVDKDKCTGCGKCVKACPNEALSME